MSSVWLINGNYAKISDPVTQHPKISNSVWVLENSMEGLYLNKIKESFEFPYKIYGIESEFINRVIKTYNNTKGNLGVLFNGLKGTGKTVTAELLCNTLDLPVVLINRNYEGLNSFLNAIPQDVILFFDEFEKTFGNSQSNLLTLMDGVFNSSCRKIFLLTTNELQVNPNLIQRPGRVRYIKTFGDLDIKNITEIVEDKLVEKQLKNEVIKFISQLEIITVDVVKSIIEEVNIHKEDPENFKNIFNVKKTVPLYNIYQVKKDGTEKIYIPSIYINLENLEVGDEFYVAGAYLGETLEISEDQTIIKAKVSRGKTWTQYTYRIEETINYNRIFSKNHGLD